MQGSPTFLVGQGKRWLESGFGNRRRVSAGRKVSLGGSGGGEGKRRRWTDGCPVAARGWGVAEDPPLDRGLS